MRVRIGTRRSRLALAQAAEVAGLLETRGHRAELVPMSTAGDRGASPSGAPAGVKGLFVAEITDALLRREVDLAVHSAKDLPSDDPDGIVIAAVPRRADPGDVLVVGPAGVGPGSVVGTSSLRRRAQILLRRPELRVRDLRGNVDTRLRKLADGEVDALVLAAAGLGRLELALDRVEPIPVDEMVPAPGQGALAVQAVVGSESAEAAADLDHEPSHRAFDAERRLVRLLGGGCRLPLGAYAEPTDEGVRLVAIVARPDGSEILRAEEENAPREAAASVADRLLEGGAARILGEVS